MSYILLQAINAICPVELPIGEALQGIARRRDLPKGTLLLNEGDVSHEAFYLETGLMRAFYYEDNREVTSWMAREDSFIWPMPSYLLRRPSRETIELLEPSTLFVLSRDDIEELKQRHEALADLECRLMEKYLLMYERRVRMLLFPKAEKRLEAYASTFPDLYQRVPLRYIASYLGIDPATLSRLRAGYKRK